ncbi:hypothetical protein KCU81_g3690, partial [Aureobasidium melanogenum]|uniref:C3H1-type domain-containing protein n=1 Tax=Aureobasidium melanogenum (strain CBS 110374) TaxID=1043003 RepID=A0A074VJ73_AURM1
MAACPATIHALNVYGDSLQRLDLDQQQLFNDLIVRVLQVECASAPQDLSHSASMQPTHVVSKFDHSSNNLAVPNSLSSCAQLDDAAQHGFAPCPPSNLPKFGGASQHEEPNSTPKPSSAPNFAHSDDAVQRNEPSSAPVHHQHYENSRKDESSTVQHDDECPQTASLSTSDSVVVSETYSTQSHSLYDDKVLKVNLSAATSPVTQPVINKVHVTTSVPLESNKTPAESTAAPRVNKFRRDGRRSSRFVPSIMLRPTTRSRRLLIEGPDDRAHLGIDDEEEEHSSDDEDDDQQNNFSMIFHHFPDPESTDFVSVDLEHVKSLLEYCPYSLTYSGRACPLGEDCTLKKVCHRNSNPVGCSKESCPYSHDILVSCRTFLKDRRCKHAAACRYNHDHDLRVAVRDKIDDHVKHCLFGAKIQAAQEEENSGKENKVN